MSGKHVMTKDGLERIRVQLEQLKEVERPEVIKEIAEARSHGDLRENSQYSSAKEKQQILEARIASFEELVATSEVFDPESMKDEKTIKFGAKVVIQNIDDPKQTREFQLVSEVEANLEEGLVAVTAPNSKILIGKSVGDIVEIKAAKASEFKVMKISY